ncbi:hypothetical protein [Streptomyces sp. NPDC056660]|uniref:hypothetical protein n=1 Tax=Streptomyces sp. NPDC056660 TaxID=3345897 RepID=UPI003698E4E1
MPPVGRPPGPASSTAPARCSPRGFQRTTVRAEAVQARPAQPADVGTGPLVDRLLTTLDIKLGGLPDGTLATPRSMLTDPDAAEHARRAMGPQIEAIATALPEREAEDAENAEDAELCPALTSPTEPSPPEETDRQATRAHMRGRDKT